MNPFLHQAETETFSSEQQLMTLPEARQRLKESWMHAQIEAGSIREGVPSTSQQRRVWLEQWMQALLQQGLLQATGLLPTYATLADLFDLSVDQVGGVIRHLRQQQWLPAKKPRVHKGIPSWTRRDLVCLGWLAQQRAVHMGQLQRLLAEESQGDPQDSHQLSWSRTTHTIARWVRGGLVCKKKFLMDQPAWCWVTARGMHHLALPYPVTGEPAASTLAHLAAINDVRLHLEAEAIAQEQSLFWTSERWLQYQQKRLPRADRWRHIPDALIKLEGTIWEIEVERTRKHQDFLTALMRGEEDFSTEALRYYVEPAARTTVLAAFRTLSRKRGNRPCVEIYDARTFACLGHWPQEEE